jgi:coproporphyrinogen III oxidase
MKTSNKKPNRNIHTTISQASGEKYYLSIYSDKQFIGGIFYNSYNEARMEELNIKGEYERLIDSIIA